MKKKIISVLYYPFMDKVVFRVTRSTDYFGFGQVSRWYSAEYGTQLADSLFYWYTVLQRLNELHMYAYMEHLHTVVKADKKR